MPSTSTEWIWWIVSVVVVGFVVSVASSLVSRHLETPYNSLIDELLTRSPKYKARVNRFVDLMSKDSAVVTVIYAQHQSIRAWIRFWVLIAGISLLLSAVALYTIDSSLQHLVTIPGSIGDEDLPESARLAVGAFLLASLSLGVGILFWIDPHSRVIQATINEFERRIFSGTYPSEPEKADQA